MGTWRGERDRGRAGCDGSRREERPADGEKAGAWSSVCSVNSGLRLSAERQQGKRVLDV